MIDWALGLFEDCFRWILWLLIKPFLMLTDMMYSVFKAITKINFTSNGVILNMFLLVGVLLVAFLVYRIMKVVFKSFVDSEFSLKYDPVKIIPKLIVVSLFYMMTPTLYSIATTFTMGLVNAAPAFMDVEVEDISISDFIIQGGKIAGDQDISIDDDNEIVIDTENYREIDINEKDENDKYIYFDDTMGLIFVIIVAIALWYLLILISISYAVRNFSIAIKYIFGAYFISGLVEENDKSFGSWVKHIGADMFSNIIQVVTLHLVVVLVSGDYLMSPLSLGGLEKYLVKAIIMVAGLLVVLMGPAGIAQILGGDGAGSSAVLQGMYQVTTISGIGHKAGSILTTAAAGAVYMTGRAAGAPSYSKSPLSSNSETNNPESFSASASSLRTYAANSGKSMPPTEKQLKAAKDFNIPDAESMDRRELSLALEAAGLDESSYSKNARKYANLNGTKGNNQNGNDTMENYATSSKRVAKMMSEAANKNKAARVAYRGSRLIYEASARRVYSSKLQKPLNLGANSKRAMHYMFSNNEGEGGTNDE